MKDPIVQVGDPVLRMKAEPVAVADISSPKIKKLIKHMKDVLAKEEYGVALAAPQVGESLRLFVVAGRAFAKKTDDEEDTQKSVEPDRVFINPQLSRLSKKTARMDEGCLSVRHQYGAVMRHEKTSIKALDEQGRPLTYHGTGLIAHIFQHECDHLEGVLYIDKAVHLTEDREWQQTGKKKTPAR